MKNKKVIKNEYGFFELEAKPTQEELSKYYQEKYYQESRGSYEKKYSANELLHINNMIKQKYMVLHNLLRLEKKSKKSILDIGAGEGWVLNYFKNEGWDCTGLDFSKYGCSMHNPDCVKDLIIGDVYENIHLLLSQDRKFNIIWMGNLLEHVSEPYELLSLIKGLVAKENILVVVVPNDFSATQELLLTEKYISRPFWILYPDHISYFNRKGLVSICNKAGWEEKDIIGSFPIDFNLFNKNTNYVENKTTGKSCHKSRIDIDNFLMEVSPEKTIEIYRNYAEIGIGRNIIGFFKG